MSKARNGIVAVAIDRDHKSSLVAFRWALDNVVSKGQTLTLVHVNSKLRPQSVNEDAAAFTPFRCFCTRKDVECEVVVLEATDVARAIIDFVANAAVEKLVVGSSSSRNGFVRSFRLNMDISDTIQKSLPDFCTFYTIYKGKVTSVKNAVRPPPPVISPALQNQPKSTKSLERSHPQRVTSSINSDSSDGSFESQSSNRSGCSFSSHETSSSQATEVAEAEIRRLRLELRQTLDMYSAARREAHTAKRKTKELQSLKCMSAPEASKNVAESGGQKMNSAGEAREKNMDGSSQLDFRYRRYTVKEIEAATNNYAEDRKIGEGGYGPVYKCFLGHTPAAVKVLRADGAAAEQGRAQFQQEVEILCRIRHPNMVLLLGACPENGCLVYEYMANGSLEDRLFRQGDTPPLPWQHRFRIAAEIGRGLLFLHQSKPEPLVHRDLKPANILLDRNYVSKIGDVGLARLIPPSAAENVTRYWMTAAAGTFCYIDPEYQQTALLGTKSDIYSLGIILLQLVTGRPPMGLAHAVELAVEGGDFGGMLDPLVRDWPAEEALRLAKLALRCAELRRKDRPDLATVVLPELERLGALAEKSMRRDVFGNATARVG